MSVDIKTAAARPLRHICTPRAAVAAALLAAAGVACATEGGGSIYPLGTENYGCCALPPPGL